MTEVQLRGEFAGLFPELSRPWTPTLPPAAQEPAYVAVNHDPGRRSRGCASTWLAESPAGTLGRARPRRMLAAATTGACPGWYYAGHAAGGYSPVLGDGRFRAAR